MRSSDKRKRKLRDQKTMKIKKKLRTSKKQNQEKQNKN